MDNIEPITPFVQIKNANIHANTCQVQLNLSWNAVVGFVDLITQLSELGAARQRWEAQRAYSLRGIEAQHRREAHFFAGLAAARQARREKRRIGEVSPAIAEHHGLHPFAVACHGRNIRFTARKRYRRMRNSIICRLSREGTAITAIAARFKLSKGRVSQIVKEAI